MPLFIPSDALSCILSVFCLVHDLLAITPKHQIPEDIGGAVLTASYAA